MKRRPSSWRPRARLAALVIEDLDGETLVYDRETHQAHCLRADAARVLVLADGERSVDAIAEAAALEVDATRGIVDELLAGGMLAAPPGPTRRGLFRRALPVLGAVTTIVVPEAAAAASCSTLLQSCLNRPCCPGRICVLQPTAIRICL